MFVAGLIVGPILGLLLGDALRDHVRPAWLAIAGAGLGLLVFLAVPVVRTEMRVGLTAGILLGMLMSFTPMTLAAPSPEPEEIGRGLT